MLVLILKLIALNAKLRKIVSLIDQYSPSFNTHINNAYKKRHLKSK